MKQTLPIFFIFLYSIGTAQTFKQKEVKRLNSYGITLENMDLKDQSNYLNLESILKKDKKRRTNKTFGIALTSLSALSTTFGALIIANSRDDEEGVGQSVGTTFIVIGAIELGVSIPLFISANKRKKERNKLIQRYN